MQRHPSFVARKPFSEEKKSQFFGRKQLIRTVLSSLYTLHTSRHLCICIHCFIQQLSTDKINISIFVIKQNYLSLAICLFLPVSGEDTIIRLSIMAAYTIIRFYVSSICHIRKFSLAEMEN